MTAHAGIIALNTVHLQLSVRSTGIVRLLPSENPSDRWHALMMWLFGLTSDSDPHDEPVHVEALVSAREQRIIDDLLGAAGAFLMMESSALGDQVNAWLAANPIELARRQESDDTAQMRAALTQTTAAGRALLLHVGQATWQEVIESRAEASRNQSGARLGVPAEEHPPVPTTAVIVDERSGLDALSSVNDVRQLILKHISTIHPIATHLALVVIAIDGRQTDPVLLNVTHPPSMCADDSALLEHYLLAATRPVPTSSETDESPAHAGSAELRLLDRIESLVSAMMFTVEALDPAQIIVVSDASLLPRSENGINAASVRRSPDPSGFIARMRENGCLPDLHDRIVSLVAPRGSTVFDSYWAALCSECGVLDASSRLELSNRTSHTPAARRRSTSSRLAIVVGNDVTPRRVLLVALSIPALFMGAGFAVGVNRWGSESLYILVPLALLALTPLVIMRPRRWLKNWMLRYGVAVLRSKQFVQAALRDLPVPAQATHSDAARIDRPIRRSRRQPGAGNSWVNAMRPSECPCDGELRGMATAGGRGSERMQVAVTRRAGWTIVRTSPWAIRPKRRAAGKVDGRN